MEYFDYESAAREAGLSAEQLEGLRRVVLRDYPNDPMLFELHMLRACQAVQQGKITIDQVLAAGVGAA